MEKVWSTFSTGPPRIYPRSPASGTLSGLDSPVQTAQSAIIGVPVSYRTYRRDTPLSIDRGTPVSYTHLTLPTIA